MKNVRKNLALIFIFSLALSTLSVLTIRPVQAQMVTATITVGTAPRGVAVTPDGAYVYIANSENNSVSVMSTATNTVISTVTGFNNPYGEAVTPNGAYVYVTNLDNGSVSVISTSTAITSPTSAPTTSPIASPSPSPTIFQFNTASLILVLVCVLAVTAACAFVSHIKSIGTQTCSKQMQRRKKTRTICLMANR